MIITYDDQVIVQWNCRDLNHHRSFIISIPIRHALLDYFKLVRVVTRIRQATQAEMFWSDAGNFKQREALVIMFLGFEVADCKKHSLFQETHEVFLILGFNAAL